MALSALLVPVTTGPSSIDRITTDITAWMQLIPLSSTNARRWEPKRLRLRLFTTTAALTGRSRQAVLTLNQNRSWATVAHLVVTALRALPTPG